MPSVTLYVDISMRQLTPEGQQIINNLAQRYQFSADAVLILLNAIVNGNGSMAQFNHPELGGSGQWMRGGMIMLGDMFNNALKNSVSQLCQELANLIANQPNLIQTGSFQSQSQSSQPLPQHDNGTLPVVPLFTAPALVSVQNWWPTGLQFPNSTGSQNNMRYAYFATIRRLAIQANGRVTLYDTLDHQITGFSQQQSASGTVTFNSQYGRVEVNTLPIISIDNIPVQVPVYQDAPINTPPSFQDADIFGTIEKLATLNSKGILSNEEFNAKKAELLARL